MLATAEVEWVSLRLTEQDACESFLAKAKSLNVGVLARLPLASGLLSGKMRKDMQFSSIDHRNYNKDGDAFSVGETVSGLPYLKGLELVEELRQFVPDDMTMAQFALRWCLDQDGVSSVLAGASNPEQVKSNAAAASFPSLPKETHDALRELHFSKIRQHIRGNI